ncbi:MAG TPA: SRPBCC domain-containing protein [Solirubrobacteraceae bacterium]|nr:SRPBCC domain-containing protein [Solirubrobacteraceae bacterium]
MSDQFEPTPSSGEPVSQRGDPRGDRGERWADPVDSRGERGDPRGDRVDRELVIPAPLEAVWRVITQNGWLADRVEFDLAPGADAHFLTGDCERLGWVEDARSPDEVSQDGRPGAHLVFWWSRDDQPASRVEIRLDPEGEQATRLRLTESRPLEVLHLLGAPLPGSGRESYGPSLLVAA